MRPCHSTLSSSAVSAALCQLVVLHLALADYGRSVPATLLARVLLLASCLHRSPSWVASHSQDCPSDETIRKALLANLPGQPLLLAHLLDAWHALLPARLRRQPLPAALDLHLRPYYGDPHTQGVSGGPHQAGTDYFWAYATLVLLVEGRRYTIGLTPVDRRQPLAPVVQTLLRQAQQAGVRLRYLLLDRGFYDAEVIACLQQQKVPFVMPMLRRGNPERGSGTTRFFRTTCATGWYTYSWTASPKRRDPDTGQKHRAAAVPVSVRVCVWQRGGQKRPWVFVSCGLSWPPLLVVKRYRGRFGIETSYRQIGEVLGVTTSKDERVRLLLLGLALVVRQYWCWGVDEVLGSGGQTVRARQQQWRLADLLVWLIVTLTAELGYRLEVTAQGSAPPEVAA